MAQAMRIIKPFIIYCIFESIERNVSPTKMRRSSTTPIITPLILPIPPTNETPPITHAAIASSS